MNYWKLIWEQDKWGHLAGAFMLTKLTYALTLDMLLTVVVLATGSILLEVYQWQFQPYYTVKKLDTVLDLVADSVGIILAVII